MFRLFLPAESIGMAATANAFQLRNVIQGFSLTLLCTTFSICNSYGIKETTVTFYEVILVFGVVTSIGLTLFISVRVRQIDHCVNTVESCSENSELTYKDIERRGLMIITSVARHLFAYLKIGVDSMPREYQWAL